MYRRELNERSPMRVFERSMRGGLGRGNLGVVVSRPGLGKTPLLVQIALDHLMRDRRVLHVAGVHAVDHVRAFYGEIFHEICAASGLADRETVMLEVERHRLIFSLLGPVGAPRDAGRVAPAPVDRIGEVVAFARDVAHFAPDVIVIDGFELFQGSEAVLLGLREAARSTDAELWVSASAVVGPARGAAELPAPLARFAGLLDVVVGLEEVGDAVHLRLMKDHGEPVPAALNLRLDPHTMRVIDETLGAVPERPRDASRFRLVSGGCKGAEAEFGACAERHGIEEVNFTYAGNPQLVRQQGLVILTEDELARGEFSLVYASRRLGRPLTRIPFVRNVLQAIWHQITSASQVFAVGVIQGDATVKGGTGWGVELARLWNKPLFVFDQDRGAWFRWSGAAWELVPAPTITRERFAGIGTQTLSERGRVAIQQLFQRSFGGSTAP